MASTNDEVNARAAHARAALVGAEFEVDRDGVALPHRHDEADAVGLVRGLRRDRLNQSVIVSRCSVTVRESARLTHVAVEINGADKRWRGAETGATACRARDAAA
jgi:hypothetical protein